MGKPVHLRPFASAVLSRHPPAADPHEGGCALQAFLSCARRFRRKNARARSSDAPLSFPPRPIDRVLESRPSFAPTQTRAVCSCRHASLLCGRGEAGGEREQGGTVQRGRHSADGGGPSSGERPPTEEKEEGETEAATARDKKARVAERPLTGLREISDTSAPQTHTVCDRETLLLEKDTHAGGHTSLSFALPKDAFPSPGDLLVSGTDPWRALEDEAALLHAFFPSAERSAFARRQREWRSQETNEGRTLENGDLDFQSKSAVSVSEQGYDFSPVCSLEKKTRKPPRERERGRDVERLHPSQDLLTPPLRRYLTFANKECISAIDFAEDVLNSLVVASPCSENLDPTPSPSKSSSSSVDSSSVSSASVSSASVSSSPSDLRRADCDGTVTDSSSHLFSAEEELFHTRRFSERFCGKSVVETAKEQAVAELLRSCLSRPKVYCSPAVAASKQSSRSCQSSDALQARRGTGNEQNKEVKGERRRGEREEEEISAWKEAAWRQVEAAAQAGEVADSLSVEVLDGRWVYYERPSPFDPGYPVICRRRLPEKKETVKGREKVLPPDRGSGENARGSSEAAQFQEGAKRNKVSSDACPDNTAVKTEGISSTPLNGREPSSPPSSSPSSPSPSSPSSVSRFSSDSHFLQQAFCSGREEDAQGDIDARARKQRRVAEECSSEEAPPLLTLADVFQRERDAKRRQREIRKERGPKPESLFLSPCLEPPGLWTALDVLRGEEQLLDVGWLTTGAAEQDRQDSFSDRTTRVLRGADAEKEPEERQEAARVSDCRVGALKAFDEAALLGYTRCLDSSERYTLHFKDLLSVPRFPASFSGSSTRPCFSSCVTAQASALNGQTETERSPRLWRNRPSACSWDCQELPGVSLGFVKDFEFFAVGDPSGGSACLHKCTRELKELAAKTDQQESGILGAAKQPRVLGCMYTSVDPRTGRPHMLRRCLLALHRPHDSVFPSFFSPVSLASLRSSGIAKQHTRNAEARNSTPHLELLRDEIVLDLSDETLWGAMHVALGKTPDGRFFTITATSRCRTASWILSATNALDAPLPVMDGPTHFFTTRGKHLLLFDVSQHNVFSAFSLSLEAVLEGQGVSKVGESSFWFPLSSFESSAPVSPGESSRRTISPGMCYPSSEPMINTLNTETSFVPSLSESSSAPPDSSSLSSSLSSSSLLSPSRSSPLSSFSSSLSSSPSPSSLSSLDSVEAGVVGTLRATRLFHLSSFLFTDLDLTPRHIAVYGLRPPSCPVVVVVELADSETDQHSLSSSLSDLPPSSPPSDAFASPPSPPFLALSSSSSSLSSSSLSSSSLPSSSLSPSPDSSLPSLSTSPALFSCPSASSVSSRESSASQASPSWKAQVTAIRLSALSNSSGVGVLQPGVNHHTSVLRFLLQSPFDPFLQCSLDLRTKAVRTKRLHTVDLEILKTAAKIFLLRFFPSLAFTPFLLRDTGNAFLSSLSRSSSSSLCHSNSSSSISSSCSPLSPIPASPFTSSASCSSSYSSSLSSSSCFTAPHSSSAASDVFAAGLPRSLSLGERLSETEEAPLSRVNSRARAESPKESEDVEKPRSVGDVDAVPLGKFDGAEPPRIDREDDGEHRSFERNPLGKVEVISLPSRDGTSLIPVTLLLPANFEAEARGAPLASQDKGERHECEGKARETLHEPAEKEHAKPANLALVKKTTEDQDPPALTFTISVNPFSSRFSHLCSSSATFPTSSSVSSVSSLSLSSSGSSLSSCTASCVSCCRSHPDKNFRRCSQRSCVTDEPFAFRCWAASPLLLLAYGAYKRPLAVSFSPLHLLLLSLGWRVAFVHCRGEGAGEREGRESGRGLQKHETLDDLEDAIDAFVAMNVAERNSIFLKTSSAGGVLAGAFLAFQQLRTRVRGVVIRHGFFDVYTAMRQESGDARKGKEEALRGDKGESARDEEDPLRRLEEAEWGNPNCRGEDETDVEREERNAHLGNILSYSPYTNFHPPRGYLLELAKAKPVVPRGRSRYCFGLSSKPAARSEEVRGDLVDAQGDFHSENSAKRIECSSGSSNGVNSVGQQRGKWLGNGQEERPNGERNSREDASEPSPQEREKEVGVEFFVRDYTGERRHKMNLCFPPRGKIGEEHPTRIRDCDWEFPSLLLSSSLGDGIVKPWHSAKLLGKLETMRSLGEKGFFSVSRNATEGDRHKELLREANESRDAERQLSSSRKRQDGGGEARGQRAARPVAGAHAASIWRAQETHSLERKSHALKHTHMPVGDVNSSPGRQSLSEHHASGRIPEGNAFRESHTADEVDECVSERKHWETLILFKLKGDAEGHCGSENRLSQFRDEAEELCFFYRVLQNGEDKESRK
ncbi:UNVERIFIED_CONTAM: hypothetical protein HHA_219485 [Hammondia hammondi]|eukprot:XP_008889421.1 hypothetical protein HHA_219485 [Hammondia hammondi]